MTPRTSLMLIRLTLAGLIAAHGWARLLAGAVDPFGTWLGTQGIPLGMAVAWGITVIEIAGSPLLALGRLVFPLSVAFAAIYAAGIAMVHMHAGWFVVGLGRNGMEFSVLLIVCLLCVGLQERALRRH
jgi:putative oxidoreductase